VRRPIDVCLALNPVRHAAFLDLQVHFRYRILAVDPGRIRGARAAPRSVPRGIWEARARSTRMTGRL